MSKKPDLTVVPGLDPAAHVDKLKADYEFEAKKYTKATLVLMPTEKLQRIMQGHFHNATQQAKNVTTLLGFVAVISEILTERKGK